MGAEFQQRNKPQYYVTTDAAVFTIKDKQLHLLLVKRKNAPYAGHYALPGGFVEDTEDLHESVARELSEETNVSDIYLEQLRTFGTPGRDPRGRVVTVAYLALIDWNKVSLNAQTDAAEAVWVPLKQANALAFDHDEILKYALTHLRSQILTTRIAFQLLPKEFTLTELQKTYEVVLDTQLDKRNFRKKLLAEDILVDLKKTKMQGAHRPARLYMFKE